MAAAGMHRESPVILEDGELNNPSVENANMPTPTAVNISTVELKKPTEPTHEQVNMQDQYGTSLGGLQEPKHSSPNADQQKQEAVSGRVMVEDGRSMPEQAELAESCSYGDGREVAGGNANSSECGGSNYSINDADDKELRPAKRQKWDAYSLPNATPLKLSNTEKSEPASLAMDLDKEWEIRNIVDRKVVGGIVHYLVDWEPTWMGEFELDGARELISGFLSQPQFTKREGWVGEGCCSRRGHKIRGSGLLSNGESKRRGRPQKQTCN